MGEIINFNCSENSINLTKEDIFNLFLIFKNKVGPLEQFDLNILMQSLAKHRNLKKFNSIFKSILIEKNENGKEIINLREFLAKKKEKKLIFINPDDENDIFIIGTEENFKILASKYNEDVLEIFNNLMFYIDNDLEFGVGNWEIFAQDELIEVLGYPSIVTGEFIEKDKNNSLVKKKIKQRAQENLKNIYS